MYAQQPAAQAGGGLAIPGGSAGAPQPATGTAPEAGADTTGSGGRRFDGTPEEARAQRNGHELLVLPYDPATSVPIRSLAENVERPVVSETISESETAGAKKLKGELNGDLEDLVPEQDEERDLFDRDRDEPALKTPVFEIYAASVVRVEGSDNRFHPQEIGLLGHESGGNLGLSKPIQFPMIFLSFGQSILLTQQGPVIGSWDPATGQVNLQLPVSFVDSDGDAALVQLELTTGTTYARDPEGEVLAMTGVPRQQDGLTKLVGLEKLVGGGMFLDGSLAQIEILARIDFATSLTSSLRSDLRSN
jgi:hypothetical protein